MGWTAGYEPPLRDDFDNSKIRNGSVKVLPAVRNRSLTVLITLPGYSRLREGTDGPMGMKGWGEFFAWGNGCVLGEAGNSFHSCVFGRLGGE